MFGQLPPIAATALFTIAILAGHQFRRNWKNEGPAWKAWLFGVVAAGCFAAVAFVPLSGI